MNENASIGKEYIPFGKPDFTGGEVQAVADVLLSGWVGRGGESVAFEEELAQYVGAAHVLTVSSCTAALFLSLLVNDVGPGDEVICPSLTWCSDANAVLYLGATPVFCDVDSDTLCLTPESVRAKLTQKSKAVIAVHFGGLPCDIAGIQAVLPGSMVLIEDAAHALGATLSGGNRVGSSGNLTCFSFYANKNLSTADGGAIATSDGHLAARLAALRQNGLPSDAYNRYRAPHEPAYFEPVGLGYKLNYTDLQACIGRVQLRRQPAFHDVRLKIAQCYEAHLRISAPSVRFQSGILDARHARHLITIQLPLKEMSVGRDELLRELHRRNVGATIHYAPLHRMSLYGNTCALPITDMIHKSLLTLPIGSGMCCAEAEYCASQLSQILRDCRTKVETC
jgi:perosamine synthetase